MKVVIDGKYDAIQIHLRLSTSEKITEDMKTRIESAVRIPMSGFVAVNIFSNRVIVTSSAPPENKEMMAKLYKEAIEKALTNTKPGEV